MMEMEYVLASQTARLYTDGIVGSDLGGVPHV